MSRVRGLVFLLSFFSSFLLKAQTLKITDKKTKEPLEMVTIMSQDPKRFTTTNSEGQADLSDFKDSKKILISYLGYKTFLTDYLSLNNLNFEVEMNPTGLSLNEFTVSATRWAQPTKDVAAKITSINPKDLVLENPQTTADLLGSSGEVFIQKSQQGGGSPIIRGFSANRLLYAVDGIRMNNAIFRSGNLQNVISLDAFTLENTEIVFGPGSVNYGSDAIGGVMSFQTLTPQLSVSEKPILKIKANTRYATANNEKTGHVDFNLGFKKFSSVSSFTFSDFEDLKMGSFGPNEYLRNNFVDQDGNKDVIYLNTDSEIQNPSGYNQFNLMQKFRFRPNNNWDINYGFHYSETSDYGRYDRHLRTRNGFPRYGEWSYGPQIWMMNNLNISHQSSYKMYDQLTIRLAQQNFKESRISRDLFDTQKETWSENVDAYSINIDLNKGFGPKFDFYYGAEAVINDVTSIGKVTDIITSSQSTAASRYPNSTWSTIAAYANGSYFFSSKFSLQGGIRYSHFIINSEFDTTFYPLPVHEANLNSGGLTGNLGMVYTPSEKWNISANLATGFRAPNVDDIGKVFDSEPGAVVVPNQNLQAEYAYNGELSIQKVFGDFLKLEATGYYTLLNNALVRRNFTLNGLNSITYSGELSQVQAVQNAAQARVFGFQTGFEFKHQSGVKASSKFNFQKGEEELDDGTINPSRHAAPWFGVSKIGYKKKGFELLLYTQYSGGFSFEELPPSEKSKDFIYAIDKNGNPYSPSWLTYNVKGIVKSKMGVNFSFGVENISDLRYLPYSSGLVAPGRNFIFSLQYTFKYF